MAKEPPPPREDPGLKPPDTAADISPSRTGTEQTRTAGWQAEPIVSKLPSSGPHHLASAADDHTALASAPVTTPSDAQGGHGAGYPAAGTDASADADLDALHTPEKISPEPQHGSYAAAVRTGAAGPEAVRIHPVPRTVAGTWTPRELHDILATLGREWHLSHQPQDTVHYAELRALALRPSAVHTDTALRERTAMETEALMAYANKQLELPHAPRFLKATMPLLQRAMLEQYHEAFIEVTLTAEVAPRAKLRRGMTHNALVALLFTANTDSARGRQMIGRLMDDVKMLYFDGGHTLKFVFNSRRLADIYAGLAFRINGTCIVLDDTETGKRDGTYRAERMKRQYAVRVYGARQIGLVALIAALNQLPDVEIVDAERPRIDPTEITDNRYLLLRFSTEDCPLALRGVTKIDFQGQMITVHHHLLQQRMPCARCYVPYHTTGFCKATLAQIPKRQEKYLRKYNGNLPSYHVGQELQYKHSDADSFINFLQTMQREVAMTSVSPSHDLPQEGVATLTTTAAERLEAGATSTTIHATTPSSEYATGPAGGDTTGPGADGFHTARRKGGKVRLEGNTVATQAMNALRRQVVNKGDLEVAGIKAPTPDSQREAVAATPSAVSTNNFAKAGKPKAGKMKRKNKKQTFMQFKKERALGRFEALADPADDSSEFDSEEEKMEAPYAYVDPSPRRPQEPLLKLTCAEMTPTTEPHQAPSPAVSPATPAVARPLPMDTTGGSATSAPVGTEDLIATGLDMEVDVEPYQAQSSDLSSYVGSSAPSSPQSPAPTPGSEFPYSLVSSRDEDMGWSDSLSGDVESQPRPDSPQMRALQTTEEEESSRVLSQDGFILERTTPAPGMPQQLPVFLMPFQGSLTTVPPNGQCAYVALYATTTSTVETKVEFTSQVVRGANAIKRCVYTMMMANLANDVECNVVDPRRELTRLYPTQPAPTDLAVATAALYTHYSQERARSVNASVPSAFWAGPEVLRAMAQYLREPLFVLDVDQANDAHVQRYFYQDYTLPNGDIHETGCGGAMTDATAKGMLRAFANLHVLPVFMVLKRHEGHFYGVHHGALSTRWQAEGDLAFAQDNCANHEWFNEVIAHMEYCESRTDEVDCEVDTDEANAFLIGTMERRDRLDIVHDRLQLPRLDNGHYDMDILTRDLPIEAARLQAQAGNPGAGSAVGADPLPSAGHRPVTSTAMISKHGRVSIQALQRILNTRAAEPDHMADRTKLRQLRKENHTALRDWMTRGQHRQLLNLPAGSTNTLLEVMTALIEHRVAIHELLATLPYPELAVKVLPKAILLRWGDLEAYDVQVAAIRHVLLEETASIQAKDYCNTWLHACTTDDGSLRDRTIARDPDRWRRLASLFPEAPAGARPTGIDPECWAILHTLQHAAWAWEVTPWGAAPRTILGSLYHDHPALQRLCESVAAWSDWGEVISLPSGFTWEDRMVSMETGLSAQAHY